MTTGTPDLIRLPVTEDAADHAARELSRQCEDGSQKRNTAVCLGEAGATPWLVVSGRWTIVGVQTGPEGCYLTLQRVL